jgi:hypothetical protein
MESEDSVRDEMILLSSSEGNKNKGTWKEVFNAKNRVEPLIDGTRPELTTPSDAL